MPADYASRHVRHEQWNCISNVMYQERTYRNWIQDKDLYSYSVIIKETDLYIRTSCNLNDKAFNSASKFRNEIENYIKLYPDFSTSFKPLPIDIKSPDIIKDMAEAAEIFDVGPMASIAGAISEYVGKDLLAFSEEVIIENGGDIFISSKTNRTVAIYAGNSALNGKYGIDIGRGLPTGYLYFIRHSRALIQLRKRDAVVILAGSATIADAAATSICNMVKTKTT